MPTPEEKAEYEHEDGFDAADQVALLHAPKPKVEPAPKFPHPRGLVRSALSLGASQADIDATETDALYDWVETERERISLERERNAAARAARDDIDRALRPEAKPAPVEQELDWGTDFDGKPLDADTYLAPGIKKLLKDQAKRIAELEKGTGETKAQLQSRRNQEIYDTFDTFFGQFPKVYGKGDGADMKAGDKNLERRLAIISAAGVDFSKDTPQAVVRKLKAKHEIVYEAEPEEEDQPEPDTVADPIAAYGGKALKNGTPRITEDQYKRSKIAKPTPREREEPRSKKKAVQAVARQMRENGFTEDDFDEEATLPD